MPADYSTLENPYTSGVLRETSPLNVSGESLSSESNSDGQSVSRQSEETKDTWLEGTYKSRNYAPKTTGFYLDARTGRIYATGFFVDGASMVADVGIYVGSDTFFDAPFSVDMAGNVIMNSATITGGVLHYGKTSFIDSVNAGYWISSAGLYFGAAADSTYVKYDIAGETIYVVGNLQTAIGTGQRVVLSATNNNLVFYDNNNNLRLRIGGTPSVSNVIFVDDIGNNNFPAIDIRRSIGDGSAAYFRSDSPSGYAIDVLQNSNTPGIHVVSSGAGAYAVPLQLEMQLTADPSNFFYQVSDYRGGAPLHVSLGHYIGSTVNPNGIVNASKGSTMQSANGRFYINQGDGGSGSWGNVWIDVGSSLQWGTTVTSDSISLSGLWMIVNDNSLINTTGFQSTIYDIQTNRQFAYQANIGTSGFGAGMLIKGIGSRTVAADSKHLILWDQGINSTNKVLSVGNDTQNNGYKERMYIQADGHIILGPSYPVAGGTAELKFKELAANGDHHIALKAPDSISENVQLTLPDSDGSPGQVLTTDGGGVLSWTSSGGAVFYPTVTSGSPDTCFIDWNVGKIAVLTALGDTQLTLSNPQEGQKYLIKILNQAGGPYALSWVTPILWSGGFVPIPTTTSGRYDLFTLIYMDGDYYADVSANFF